jgi:hypothetical protein
MNIRRPAHWFLAAVLLVFATPVTTERMTAQSLPTLFESGRPGAQPTARPVRPHQARKARLRLEALNAPAFRLNLFDNADRVAYRTRVQEHGNGRYSWLGTTDDGGIVSFAVVDGVTTGTVYLDGRSFEIIPDADGEHTIEELNAAAFPTEEGPGAVLEPDMAADAGGDGAVTAVTAADGLTEIGVMVLWTPAARTAAGGQANIQSLILAAVTNANLAYANSLVNARLKLVYSAEVAFAETPSNMSGDLSALRGSTDGKADGIHALRDQYGADIVSLVGNGYASAGYCGLGYLMSSPSTAYASNAFNIVDRTCAVGNLSFAHEVGHNQGLQHDPGSAGGAPSYTYAYGYQDPSGAFRTVLSYGSATRIPYLSSPVVFYNGRVTGTGSQDNARALNNNAAIVAAFKAGSSTTPSCSYSVSPTSLSFQSGGGSLTVAVTASSGCSWTSSSGSAWASVSGSGSGSGSATVTAVSNSGGARSATVTVAGVTVAVNQAAPATCSYTVSPTSLSFQAGAGTASVSVTTTAGCSWTSSSGTAWAGVSGSGSGSGTATVSVASNSGGARSAAVTVAGRVVSVSQAAAPTSTCSYAVSPTSLSFTASGGSASVTVTAGAGCAWTASSGTSWVSVSGSGSGSGTATVTVPATKGGARSGSVTVAGKTVSVSQAGASKGGGKKGSGDGTGSPGGGNK